MSHDHKTFKAWKAALDRLISARAGGMISDDFADFPMRDAYDDGTTPEDALETLAEYDEIFGEILALT